MNRTNPYYAQLREDYRDKVTGRFGVQNHSTPDTPNIATPSQHRDTVQETLASRIAAIRAGGYIEMGAVSDQFDAHSTKRIDDWWMSSFALAEQAKGGGYHVMPDDYTPGMKQGRSLTGNRRTHRMKYEGAGVTLRMPSVTAIKRYSKDINNQTFDVPVEAETPAGSIQTYVRVSAGANGTWEVTAPALNDNPNMSGYVTEAVNATLESRRPSLALREVQDLVERNRERVAAQGAKLFEPKVDSNVVEGVGYNQVHGDLYVRLSGRDYCYQGVEKDVARTLHSSYSPGKMYNARVRGNYPSKRAETCNKCGNVSVVDQPHRCRPTGHRNPKRTIKYERNLIQMALGGRKHRSLRKAFERAMAERRFSKFPLEGS